MTDQNEELGTIGMESGCYVATLKREIEHGKAAVWEMLTVPRRIVEWLAPGEIELKIGGSAKLDFQDSGIVIDSKVTAYEPEALLEYSWSSPGEPKRPLRFELTDKGGKTTLTMTLKSPLDEDIARSAAGFEAHLMMLLAAIEGVPIKFPFERFMSTREGYGELVPDQA